MTKLDRKALMKKSVGEERAQIRSTQDRRFAAAEQKLETHPNGLLAPAASSFSGETDAPKDGESIIRVDLSKVHDNPWNARFLYDSAEIETLGLSISAHGQKVPVPVMRHPSLDGHYVLIDGHYRKLALKAAGRNEIACIVQGPMDDLALYQESYLINDQRNAQTALDNAMAWRRLLDDKLVGSNDEIAESLGINKSVVSRTLSLLKLPAEALKKIQEHPAKFSAHIGYEIYLCSSVMDEVSLLKLMDRVIAEDLSKRDLQLIREKIESKPERKSKEVSRQFKIRQDAAQIGFIKEWDSGKVALEVTLTDPKEREALVEELKRRFALA